MLHDELALIARHFRLSGEDIIRVSTGEPIRFKQDRKSYAQVRLVVDGKTVTLRAHRVKFALAHGWLPKLVDHKNRNKLDDALENLRPATRSQNAVNAEAGPCVKQRKSGRWSAWVNRDGRQVGLGTHDTREQAVAVAGAARAELHGEFHVA